MEIQQQVDDKNVQYSTLDLLFVKIANIWCLLSSWCFTQVLGAKQTSQIV